MDGIIFDVDGTLWDSTYITADAWQAYLKTQGIDMEITAPLLKSLFGQLLPDIAAQLFPELSQEEQMRLIEGCCQAEHEALLAELAPVYENLEETLKELSARFPLYIVSNCQAGYIEVFLESTGYGHYFAGHLCPGDTGKPKAENIMQIVKDHHLTAPVYVGDTMGDYNSCVQAGVPFIFASYGFGSVETPDYTIDRPLDLLDICK